ncbi:hypothetical protein KAW18_09410 [candidate division WOR-3 bacterium]|nr:hypothetical protein [candidate division WOR-3 bacterium]
MKNRMPEIVLISLVSLTLLTLMAGCTAGVAQGKYDQVVAERDALKTQVKKLESELAAAKEVKPTLPAKIAAKIRKLTHEIEGTVSELHDNTIIELAILRRGPEEEYKVKLPKVAGRLLDRAQKIEHARSELHKLTQGLQGEHVKGLPKLTGEYKKAVDKLLALAHQLEGFAKEPLKNKEKIKEIEGVIHNYIHAGLEGPAAKMVKYDKLWGKLPGEIVWEYNEVTYPGFAQRLKNGNTLIVESRESDNPRIIEVTPDKEVVWEYAVKTYIAQRLPNGNTLIAELERKPDRVIEVTPDKNIIWEWECTGDSFPAGIERLPNGNTVITDGRHPRIIEITPDKEIVWEYTDHIYAWGLQCLPNGNILSMETKDTKHWTHTRLIEINRDKEVVWEYPYIDASFSSFQRLPNGNTLITDADSNRKKNPRVIEVTPDKKIVWEYTDVIFPGSVQRLENGNTLIADCRWPRVIEVAAP